MVHVQAAGCLVGCKWHAFDGDIGGVHVQSWSECTCETVLVQEK